MSGRDPTVLEGSSNDEKLRDLATRSYKEQAIWILNGFWESNNLEGDAEKFWDYVSKFSELDLENGKEGHELDEFNAHRFLELLDETLTVRAMRTKLTSLGVEKVKYVPLVHYLMFKYDLNPEQVINSPQGDNKEELEEAQRRLAEVQELLADAQQKADAAREAESIALAAEETARAAEAEAIAREEDARAAEAAAVEAEAPFKIAQEELNQALAELKEQEDAYNNKTEDLKQKSEEGGLVSRNRAKNELAQHLGTDPLPLRRAKLNTEAAERKADKARAPFKAAREKAEDAAASATAARKEAERTAADASAAREDATRSRQAADQAVAECMEKLVEAEAYMAEVAAKPGQAYGAMWWIEKDLEEARKYLPSSKQ